MRINTLGNTATDFASDDYIALDGTTNGSRKMKNDRLLKVTAQNALAGNVAPAFDSTRTSENPYKAGEFVAYNGKTYRFKVNHYGAWNLSDVVEASFRQFPSILINDIAGSSPYNDLNTFPLNTIAVCSLDGGSSPAISHKPAEVSTRAFSVITYGDGAYIKTQIFSSLDKKQFVRSCWGSTWGDWQKIEYTDGADILHRKSINSVYTSAPYNDLNTFPSCEIVQCSVTSGDAQESISHKPIGVERQPFSVVTYGASDSKTQIYSSGNRLQFIRSCWGSTWGDWQKINYDVVKEELTNPISSFDNVVCIGDSLTYGQVYTGATTSIQATNPYPKILEKLCGITSYSFAVGGYSASDAWTAFGNLLDAKPNSLAIIYLGTNGGLTDTLSTDCPEEDPYSDWANTNTGCYAKFVAKLKSLGYRVLLIKVFTTSGNLTTTNSVISQVATRFGCSVVGPIRNDSDKYHYWPNGNGKNTVHFNGLGYAWFASRLISEIAILTDDNMKYIIPS